MIAFAVTDTGIGIADDKLRADLRGVPAGRRHHQPQVRRHRPRPVDQPGDRAPARRRDPGRVRGRARAARSRSTCRRPTAGEPSGPRRRGAPSARARSSGRGATWPKTARPVWPAEHRRAGAVPVARRGDDLDDDRDAISRATGSSDRRGRRDVARVAARRRASRASRARSPSRRRGRSRWPTQFRPDAIILDIELPGVDGWSAARPLKQHPDTRHIPVPRHLGRRRRAAGAGPGAVALPRQAVDARARSATALDDARDLRRAAVQAAARRRGRRASSAGDRRADRRRRRRRRRGRHRRGGAAGAREGGASTAWCSTSGCRTSTGFELLERFEERRAVPRPAGHRLHRQGRSPAARRRGCAATPRRSSSRTPARRSGCSTRRRCSCTGARPACRPKAARCSSRLHRADAVFAGKTVLARRRRRAQRLRPHQRARGARDGGAVRRERHARARGARRRTPTSTSC